jgi:2-dehydropantoate 2-reductase
MPSLLILGAGAIGAFFGSALARQGMRVSAVCRSDYAAVKQSGFDIRSPLLGDHCFEPHEVFRAAEQAGREYDLVLLSTKVLEGVDRAELLKPVIGANTVIVLIQNGLDIEREVHTAFPRNELLSGVAFIAVSRAGAGRIHHQSAGSLTLGRYPEGLTPMAKDLAARFEASNVPCKLTQDIVQARWQKALWNATFNPISIMGSGLDTASILRTPEQRTWVRLAMTEIAGVAQAAGHPIAADMIDKLIEATLGMPAYKSSMALDFENGRPMEIEAIIGNVVRCAHHYQVPIPTLDSIYLVAKMIENKHRSERDTRSDAG